jgi:hypothetical protein
MQDFYHFHPSQAGKYVFSQYRSFRDVCFLNSHCIVSEYIQSEVNAVGRLDMAH